MKFSRPAPENVQNKPAYVEYHSLFSVPTGFSVPPPQKRMDESISFTFSSIFKDSLALNYSVVVTYLSSNIFLLLETRTLIIRASTIFIPLTPIYSPPCLSFFHTLQHLLHFWAHFTDSHTEINFLDSELLHRQTWRYAPSRNMSNSFLYHTKIVGPANIRESDYRNGEDGYPKSGCRDLEGKLCWAHTKPPSRLPVPMTSQCIV